MWLEAIITHEDLVQVVREALPVKIHLDHAQPATRWLMLHAATSVALVADQGLRITCPAELRWSIAGMHPNVKFDALSVLLRPRIVAAGGRHVLDFSLEIEEAAVHGLPAFIDATIVSAVNSALSARKLTWDFTETLTRTVKLPEILEPLEALKIGVVWGKRRIGVEALALVVSFNLSFVRRRDAAAGPA